MSPEFPRLVSDASILRALPNALDPAQRLRLNALVFASDIIDHDWAEIFSVIKEVGGDVEAMTERRRTSLFASVWSIVDQLDFIRQLSRSLLPAEAIPNPKLQHLCENLAIVRSLRNKRDHLNQNIPNIANASGIRSSLLGSIAYFLADQIPVQSGKVVVVTAGMLHGDESWPLPNPAGREIDRKISLIQLTAFDRTLDLCDTLDRLESYLKELSEVIGDDLRAWAHRKSEETGINASDLLAHSGGSYTMVVQMQKGEQAS